MLPNLSFQRSIVILDIPLATYSFLLISKLNWMNQNNSVFVFHLDSDEDQINSRENLLSI